METLHPKLYCQREFTVRTYEIDKNKLITPPAMVQLMHEAAMQNVIDLKLSVWDLAPQQISWVLMRKNLIIHRLPELGEQLKVITNPAGFEKFFTYRDYRVLDKDDKPLAEASSTWLLMDTETRRMSRIPEYIASMSMPEESDCLTRPKNKLPKFTKAEYSREFQVGYYDLDFNEHLSNIFYLRWLLEPLPQEILEGKKLSRLDIVYRAECRWNDVVISEVQKLEDGSFLHRLIRKSDSKELALGQSWSTL